MEQKCYTLTSLQRKLVGLLSDHAGVCVVRSHGVGQCCRLSNAGLDQQWRREHNKPIQAHTIAALTCVGVLVEQRTNVETIYRLRGDQ